MAFRIAKPRIADIRKGGNAITSTVESVACGLCKKNQAKYTCPECNVPYCSLGCYRGEEHRVCSEGFYKTIIEEDIRSAPGRTAEEKRGMMQILQRVEQFEQENDDDTEGEEDDLATRLKGVDIEDADPSVLWEALSPKQKEEFTNAMKDTNSPLARQLLATITSAKSNNILDPWWSSNYEDEDALNTLTESTAGSAPPLPDPIVVPQNVREAAEKGWNTSYTGVQSGLMYNILAVGLVYVFCIHKLGIRSFSSMNASEAGICRETFTKGVPFLMDKKSTTRLESVDESLTFVQSRLKEPLARLLPDLQHLFTPQIVSEVHALQAPKISATPHSKLIRCLGDIAALFPSPYAASTEERPRIHGSSLVLHKLTFYTAHVMRAPLGLIRRITDEIRIKSIIEDDKPEQNEDGDIIIPELASYHPPRGPVEPRKDATETVPTLQSPMIEEII